MKTLLIRHIISAILITGGLFTLLSCSTQSQPLSCDTKDYQIEIIDDSTLMLWDNGRFVDYLPFRDEDNLSLAIIHDNE